MWKKDSNGNLVLDAEGNPVLILADGTEKGFSVTQNNEYIEKLKSESAGRRTENSTLKEQLKAYEGIDATQARDAIEKVKSFSDKDLIDVGKVEEIKAEMTRVHEAKLAEEKAKSDAYRNSMQSFMIGQAFGDSAFIKDSLTIPADMVRTHFGGNFVVNEKNQVVALHDPNNPSSIMYSDANAGEPASVDEALAKLVQSYAHKESILKSRENKGTGNPAGGNVGGGQANTGDIGGSAEQRKAYFAEKYNV